MTSGSPNSIRYRSMLILALGLAGIVLPSSSSNAKRSKPQQPDRQLNRERAQSNHQRRFALVIGNGAYQTVKPLKNPPSDATLLAATLRKLGFDVSVGTDKSQREMKQLIRAFGQQLRTGGGVGLFYFAGHGIQARGRNFLIPVDADIQTEADLEDVAVDVNYVLSMMDDAQNALNIAVLDACRNNPFARSFRSASDGLAQVKAPTGTLIPYATAPDNVAADGGGANSPYAEELAKQMQTTGLLLETMFRRVAEQVSARSGGRQEPWYSANVKGDFYFSAGTATTALSKSGENAQPAKIDAVAVEREYWQMIRSSNDIQDYQEYLRSYPGGAYTAIARARIRQLEAAKNTPPSTQPAILVSSPTSEPMGAAKTGAPGLKGFRSPQGIEMVYIPPGTFTMGSNSTPSSKPVHKVTISQAFYMGKYEVTQGQWQAVMGTNPSNYKDCGTNCPVEHVSWNDAQDFTDKLNEANDGYRYRLPSEAEWEYACRAGTTGDHYAADVDDIGWYIGNSGNKPHAVGGKQPNAFGLFDMSGNVGEWCQDAFYPTYEGAPTDGSARLNVDGQIYRVLRGGS